MEIDLIRALELKDPSSVGDARRIATRLASEIGFGETDAGRTGIVVTEIASNLVKHSREGRLLLHRLAKGDAAGLSALAIDRGPGVENLSEAMRDGFSTTGTTGTGLGAIARKASGFDVFSDPRGTLLIAEIWSGEKAPIRNGWSLGAVSVPLAGELVCGDSWFCHEHRGRMRFLLADGLGHGPLAAAAATHAVDTFRAHPDRSPTQALETLHAALHATRGAAGAVGEIDPALGVLRFAGIGNISARMLSKGSSRSLVSHHGTLGHDARKFQEFQHPWDAKALLVLHSDGIDTHWSLDEYPGLAARHPMLVAGVLYRDHARARDDATVVVLRGES